MSDAQSKDDLSVDLGGVAGDDLRALVQTLRFYVIFLREEAGFASLPTRIENACVAIESLLALKAAAWVLVRAQGRMLDKWADGDEGVKQRLWRDLHAAGDAMRALLSPSTEDAP